MSDTPGGTWWQQNATPNAKLGIVVLAAVLAVYGCQAGGEEVDALREELVIAQEQTLPVPESVWGPRAAATAEQLRAAEAAFWRGATVGEVTARMLTAVQQAGLTTGILDLKVELASQVEQFGGVAVVRGSVQGHGPPIQAFAYLNALRALEGHMRVEQMTLRRADDLQFKVEVLAPVIIGRNAAQ